MGATYKLKRKKADGTLEDVVLTGNLPFIPSDAFTVVGGSTYNPTKWSATNVSGITTPTDGMTIAVRMPNSGGTYGIILSIDGGNNYYPIVRNRDTRVNTEYPRGSTLILTFNAIETSSVYSGSSIPTTVKGSWQIADYSLDTSSVYQYYTSQSTTYPLLFKYNERNTSTTSENNFTRFANNIYVNPSTGTIYANDFVVDGKSIVGGGGSTNAPIATTQIAGIVKPDGETITVDTDGTIHAVGGEADTFVVHFGYDGEGNLVADQSFDEIYSKIQDGKMPFAEFWGTSYSYCYDYGNEIGFRSIQLYAGSGVDGDNSNIFIDYISLNSDGYANNWSEYIEIPSGSQGSGAGQQSVTYAQLKKLRDDGKLVAGMQYRITDFVTTTSQPDTQSAGHPFNIIVTALSNTTLSENASADLPATNIANADGSLAQGSVQPYYYIYEDFDGPGEEGPVGYKPMDTFVAYNYLENSDGVVVPVIYKNDLEGYSEEGPDYQDQFYYEGTMEVDGVTYDKWRKICDSQEGGPFWDGSTGNIWVLTNIIVQDGQIGGGAVDPYFANANLPAWEIKYCLDNDKHRFAWADEGSIEAMRVYSADDENDFIYVRTPDGDNENGIAWCYVIDSEDLEFSDIADWNNYAGDDVIYTEAETVAVGDFLDMSGTEVEVVALKYGNGGKGVIYFMKDEWGNECPYDFKNIQFKRSADWFAEHSDWGESVLGYTPTEDKWFYTFTWVDENDEVQDLTLIGNTLLNDEGKISGVYANKIGICSEYMVSLNENSVEALSLNVFVNSYYYEDGVFYGCFFNILGCGCVYNTFGNSCYNNTFGNFCSRNTFGVDCSSNTFGNNCYNNTLGRYCISNTFGDNCSNNIFDNYCTFNNFGMHSDDNTFGAECMFNTFGCECYYNTLPEYAKFNIFENGVQYVALTSTTQGNIENYLKNITVSQGIKGTSNSNRKTINATRNLSYKTTYVAKGSVTTEV